LDIEGEIDDELDAEGEIDEREISMMTSEESNPVRVAESRVGPMKKVE
jgi:hypothetical protein